MSLARGSADLKLVALESSVGAAFVAALFPFVSPSAAEGPGTLAKSAIPDGGQFCLRRGRIT